MVAGEVVGQVQEGRLVEEGAEVVGGAEAGEPLPLLLALAWGLSSPSPRLEAGPSPCVSDGSAPLW